MFFKSVLTNYLKYIQFLILLILEFNKISYIYKGVIIYMLIT